MRHFSKIPSTVFTIALILVFLTGCKPEQVVKVVEIVREVPVEVIKEVPKEVTVIKEVPIPAEPEEEDLQEELIKIFNDGIGMTNFAVRSFERNSLIDAKVNGIAHLVAGELSPAGWDRDNALTNVKDSLVNPNSSNGYILTYFKNSDYNSNYYNSVKKKYLLLQEIENHAVEICDSDESIFQPSSTAQVGFAEITVGANRYTLVLFEVPTVVVP